MHRSDGARSGGARNDGAPAEDVVRDLSYYSLYEVAEEQRWKMSDIPFDEIDMSVVDDQLIGLVRSVVTGELTTYSATHAFMDLFRDDMDFTQWLAIWLYEETKHPHVLAKWLSCVGAPVGEGFLREGRSITPMTGSKVEMLTFNIISEIVASSNYFRTAKIMPEPVLKRILMELGKDEVRHSQGFEHYCRIVIKEAEDPDAERVKCLRATWAFIHSDDSVEHPVFLTDHSIDTIASDELVKLTRERVKRQVTRRISGVVGIDMDGPDEVYDVYRGLKKKVRDRRRAAKEHVAAAPADAAEEPVARDDQPVNP